MSFNIAVGGKGGVGKTTIVALIIRYLRDKNKRPILAIDADSNSNLGDALGIKVEKTIGVIAEEFNKGTQKLPPDFHKDSYLEYKIVEGMVENEGFDLLAMGRGEGSGCYCYVNNLLRKVVDKTSKNYPYIVMDNQAGMEHLSRRTTRNIDVFLLVSDYSLKGIKTAKRIKNLAEELELNIREKYLLINRFPSRTTPFLEGELREKEEIFIGSIPEDELIVEYDLRGRPLLELPKDSASVIAMEKVMEKILQKEVSDGSHR